MLKGKYVGLRAIEESDLSRLLLWRNQPNYRRFFREYRELSQVNQRNWFDSKVLNDKNTEMFSIVDVKTGELLGACGLCYIDWINRNADFSIYIGKDDLYIDEKYAIDAAQLMMKYGFEELNLHRLWAEIYNFDELKKIMFDKLGFVLEGVQKDTHWTNGKWCDSIFYGCVSYCKN